MTDRQSSLRHTFFRASRLPAAVSLAVLMAACNMTGTASASRAEPGDPVETRPPNAPDQQPAFDGQTRAPGVVTEAELSHTVVAEGLVHPWGLALLPDGNWLVTERSGRMRIVTADGQLGAPIQGLPPVVARGQGGLLDVLEGATAGFAVLRELGVQFNILEFGSGYQRLVRMAQCPIRFASIPAELMSSLDTEEAQSAVRALVATATALGAEVIALRADDVHMVEQLKAVGCAMASGAAAGPTVDARDFARAVGAMKLGRA